MTPSAESCERRDRRPVGDVVLLYDEAEAHLNGLHARFPGTAFHACTRYADLPDTLARVRPQVAWAADFEATPFPRAALVGCPSLRWLSVGFAGIERVVPWNDDELVVTNAAGVAAEEMAQYVVAAIFGMHQRFPLFARQQHRRLWGYHTIRSARDARVGLVGLGRTGEAIARMCRGVGLSVVACRDSGRPSDAVDHVYRAADLYRMLGEVDVVVTCCALTPATRDLMDAQAFAAMRRGAYFVNVARGAVVDEAALAAALSTGHLEGATIDVVRREPLPDDSPLWDVPNLTITPHTSSEFDGWRAKALDMFADNLARWIEGCDLLNRVSATRGY